VEEHPEIGGGGCVLGGGGGGSDVEVATAFSGMREVEALATSQVDAASRRVAAALGHSWRRSSRPHVWWRRWTQVRWRRRRRGKMAEPVFRGGVAGVCRGVEA
jgi:hypothetical protein